MTYFQCQTPHFHLLNCVYSVINVCISLNSGNFEDGITNRCSPCVTCDNQGNVFTSSSSSERFLAISKESFFHLVPFLASLSVSHSWYDSTLPTLKILAGDGQGPKELLPRYAETDPRQDTRIHVDTGAVQRIQELKEETNRNGNELK